MATHCSILAWRIPRTEEPGGLQLKGQWGVRRDRSQLVHTYLVLVNFYQANHISIKYYSSETNKFNYRKIRLLLIEYA